MRFQYWVCEIAIFVFHFRVSSGPYLQIRLSREGLPGDKQSSLSRQLINYGRKKFYNMRPVWQTFQRMSQVSYRLYPFKWEPLGERLSVMVKGLHVGNNLVSWTNIYGSQRKDNPRSYQDEYKEFRWFFFSRHFDFLSPQQTIDMPHKS